MRRILCIVALFSLLLFPGAPVHAADYVPGEVIVQLQPGVDISLLCRLLGLKILDRSPYAPVYRLGLPLPGLLNPLLTTVDTVVAALRLSPLVVSADPNMVTSFADTTNGTQWSSVFVDNATKARSAYEAQPGIDQVNYQSAAGVVTGAGVTVAVIDTGISGRHPFLAAQMVPGWNFVDNNANADDVPDGIDSNNNGKVDEGAGHGTMIAGIVYRFAPAANLMPIKVLDSDGAGTVWNATQGIYYAVAHGAKVINFSVGCARSSGVLDLAITTASLCGTVVVVAAGNDNSIVGRWPAGNPTALTVAALDSNNVKASFSNYGYTVDVDAPGVSIASTYWDGRYAIWSGTSFAAPMVTAEATLIRSARPDLGVSSIRSVVIGTSRSVNYWNPQYLNQLGKNGAGLIDIDAAIGAVLRR